jgi:hypothetical protein
MSKSTETNSNSNIFEAKLNAIEDGLAEFVFDEVKNNVEIDEQLKNSIYWPAGRLPDEIEPGDNVLIELNLKNREEKMEQLKERKKRELKNDEMRRMLEELVN